MSREKPLSERVLDVIRECGTATLPGIVEALGRSRADVETICKDLAKQKLIRWRRAQRGRGRPWTATWLGR